MDKPSLFQKIRELGVRTRSQGGHIVSPEGFVEDWLIDLRAVFMNRDALKQIVDGFWELFKDSPPFQVAGVETAAIPLLTAIVLRAPPAHRSINACIIRKSRKPYGLGNLIEGHVSTAPVVLVDDIINSGTSAEKARIALDQLELKIDSLFTVVDYQNDAAREWLARHNIGLESLFTLSDFGLDLVRADVPRMLGRERYKQAWRHLASKANPFHIVPKSAPVLVGARIYRGCDAGKMQAFDVRSGNIIWEFQAAGADPDKGIWSTPAIVGSRLYFGAYNGVAYCLDADTGAEIWAKSCGEWIGASPVVVPEHGLVYFGIEYARQWAKGAVAALDAHTGDPVWHHLVSGLQHGSPAYWRGGDLIIWGTADYEMLGIDAKSGEVKWSFETQRSVKYAPCIDEERGIVAFAAFDKSIYVLDAATGNLLGQWETGDICYTTPLIAGNRLFCGSGDKHMHVIDLDRMELVRSIEIGARIYCSPKLVQGKMLFGANCGRIFEMDPETLKTEILLHLADAVTNAMQFDKQRRRLFVSTQMNHLFAFDQI